MARKKTGASPKLSERRTLMTNALNEMIGVFCSHNDQAFNDVLSNALRPAAEAAGADRIVIYQYVEIAHEMRLKQLYRWDKSKNILTKKSLEYLPNSPQILRWLEKLLAGECISRTSGEMAEGESAFMNLLGIKTVLMAPIFTRGQLWGAVFFENQANDNLFSNECIDLMQSMARLCANAVIRSSLENEVADNNELNRVMFESAPIGLIMFDDKYNYYDCNREVLKIFNVTKNYYLNHFFELSPEYQPDGSKSQDRLQEIIKRTLEGEKLAMEWMHCSRDGELIPCDITMERIKHKGKYIGLGYVYDLRNIKRLEQNIQWLESEVDKIYYDPLTGIYNRRFFDKNLERVIKSLSRSAGKLSLMMIDIDRFKRYNDTYGHKEGDECLKSVAETLASSIGRVDDFVARYGGEEFVVVLPNTDENGACIIADKMLTNIRNREIPHKKNDAVPYVTISVGLTTAVVGFQQTGDDYIKRADAALYVSKHTGRNKFTFQQLTDPS